MQANTSFYYIDFKDTINCLKLEKKVITFIRPH